MIPMLATATAWAEPAEVRSETLVMGRTDVDGVPYVGGIEVLGGTASVGSVSLEGYGELGYLAGFDQAFGGEIYLLSAQGDNGPVQWTLGRQSLLLPTWNRRLDGASARLDLGDGWSIDGALGVASHVGLRGTFGGVPIARLSGTYRSGSFTATAGGWTEVSDVLVGHGDLVARWTPEVEDLYPQISSSAAVGTRAGETVLERGRADLSLLVTSGVRARAWFEHRQSLQGTKLSADILGSFAPQGSDTVGVSTGVSTANRHRLWASGSVQRWSAAADLVEPGDSRTGLVGEVRWEPRCGSQTWCFSPGWQGLTGPGGILHRAGTSVVLPLPEKVTVTVNGAWVPWRKPHLNWRSSVVAGAVATVRPASRVDLEVGGDAFVGAHAPSIRGWLSVHLRTGGWR